MAEKVFINTVNQIYRHHNDTKRRSGGKMFLTVVSVVFGAVVSECGVIQQPNVGLRWHYPLPLSYIATAPVITNYKVIQQQVPEKSVSYSISYKDYLYLHNHKINGKDSPFNPDPIRDSLVPNFQHVHNYHHSEHQGNSAESGLKSSRVSGVLKRSTGTNVAIDHNLPIVNVPLEPIVSKHIYFHVPPPDFEEKPNVPVVLPPQKKHYNIIFIKAPTYEPNYAQLQQILQSRSPAEEKTLIYVLAKTQESQVPVVLPPKSVSPPEVYYVKYKVTPKEGTKINSELSEVSLLQNVSPVLEQRQGAERP